MTNGPDFSEEIWPRDEIMLDAMAEGTDKKVLFLVDSTRDIDVLVRRTKRLTAERIRQKLGSEQANGFFTDIGTTWSIKTVLGGTLTFYPAELTSGDEEMKYDLVFWPNDRGRYERLPFSEWLRLRKAGNIWRPSDGGGVSSGGPKTVWDRI